MKQLNLIPKPTLACGGSLDNTRHIKRTLSTRNPTHLVLKAKRNILFKNKKEVEKDCLNAAPSPALPIGEETLKIFKTTSFKTRWRFTGFGTNPEGKFLPYGDFEYSVFRKQR